MWIFGGVFPRPDPQPDGCSNDIYVFSLFEEMWYMPLVMGAKPCPRSGHSATLFGNRLVVFGGWDAPICFNDVHILDLSLVEWSQPHVKGTPPSPRSWHSACALSGNRLFVHGGYSSNHALNDSFIFDLDTLSWTEVTIEPPVSARTGHVALCLPSRFETCDVDNVLLFGGGDNEGNFFADLFGISIPTKLVPSDTTATHAKSMSEQGIVTCDNNDI
jgi:N-acetylneuraminic acid mutarotase